MGFAREWGFGSIVFTNLFAFRTPYPKELRKADDPVGPRNDSVIVQQAELADKVVLAWGTHGVYRERDRDVIALLAGTFDLYCLGTTKYGHPKHPLYLKATTKLQHWKGYP